MDNYNCPKCGLKFTYSGLRTHHLEKKCKEPRYITKCCDSPLWESEEDGYRCNLCGTHSMKRLYFLKNNPKWV